MFEDFSIDSIADSVKDGFNSVKDAAAEGIEDIKDYQNQANGILGEAHSVVDGFLDDARGLVDDYGDPFGIVDSWASDYIDMAQGYVNDVFGLVDQAFGNLKPNPYQKAAKQQLTKLMQTPFKQGWQWVLEADNTPPDFDIYVKDIDMGIGSVDADSQSIGSGAIAKPTSASAGEITMTVRDHQDGRVAKWFAMQLGKVRNEDGTVNLPKDYVFNVRLKAVDDQGNRHPWKEYRVFAQGISLTLNYESQSEFITYSITLQKFSTLGNKFL
ncbi:hypothetical protein I3271_05335 [Photobacterium leiognathi]|uniref:hypothetical protein n=1 Tax=Photobacterium leiognathi TaxID=553611 RepID=UPI001EDD07B0|nr:hypothetical protein [Photobacterium leiognathi]MCG3884103.1 hypothetical protein [Photobacterium leiognathi]